MTTLGADEQRVRDQGAARDPRWLQVPGGLLDMGSSDFYPEESPKHRCQVGSFLLDRFPVTNRQFARFVEATGYLTVAEQALDEERYPWLHADDRTPGSTVFVPTTGPVDLDDWRQWWIWLPGTQWRRPRGPMSSVEGLDDHPVVHIAYADALAYANWAGARLPTEAEFEWAAYGGRPATTYAWGDERDPAGVVMANTWRGRFPYLNTGANGWTGTSPVGSFPANGYGLYDLIGNVWEWTSTYYAPSHLEPDDESAEPQQPHSCCGADSRAALASAEPASRVPRRVLKGGSHLCAPEYCLRYRPAARSAQAEDSPTSHVGFRCAW